MGDQKVAAKRIMHRVTCVNVVRQQSKCCAKPLSKTKAHLSFNSFKLSSSPLDCLKAISMLLFVIAFLRNIHASLVLAIQRGITNMTFFFQLSITLTYSSICLMSSWDMDKRKILLKMQKVNLDVEPSCHKLPLTNNLPFSSSSTSRILVFS